MENKRNISDSETNRIASRHLGSSGSYNVETDSFDSTLLVMIPRSEARGDWGITGAEFHGYDVWHCHESTFLLDNGFPIAGTLKFVYPSYSIGIVESKSMKLYLNSFDMCKMGRPLAFAILNYERQIKEDLSKLLGVDVQVRFHNYKSFYSGTANTLVSYDDLQDSFDISTLPSFDDYTAKKEYDITLPAPLYTTSRVQTNILRSRCRHTKQKDTGTFFGLFKGMMFLNYTETFKKVVSIRMLDEFHEFCCEKLFIDMAKQELVDECMIALLYSRRGSLDINPIRSTSLDLIPNELINVNILTTKTLGQ